MAFTKYQLEHLKAGPKRRVITETGRSSDERGLQVWVGTSGTKTFVMRYKAGGRTRYITLGPFPSISLADAHQKVQAHRKELREGKDPAAWHEDVRKVNNAAPTVKEIFETFCEVHLRKKKLKSAGWAEGVLTKHVIKKWGHRKAASLTRREIIKHFRAVAETHPRVAEVAKQLTGSMLAHAVNEGLLDASPAVSLPIIGSVGERRDCPMTEDQIRHFWTALDHDKIEMTAQIRGALRLLLATGQRRQEVALARWDNVDLKEKTWLIPKEHSKNGKEHVVPLSCLAMDVLDHLAAAGRRQNKDGTVTESAFVVPSRTREDRPIAPLAITAAVRKNAAIIGIPGFSPHALRHCVATQLSALGVERLHVTKVLNHSDRGITARYDSHDYLSEKRAALDLWGEHLQAILAGKQPKVTPIRKRARA